MSKKKTIINIRGTNASGKTTLIKNLIRAFGSEELKRHNRVWGYRCFFEPEFYVLGPYQNPLDGCDKLPTFRRVEKGLQKLSKLGNVLFEGVLISITHKRWVELAREMTDCHFIFATLDTPLELCIERRDERNKKMGIGRGSPKGITLKYKAVHHMHKELKKAGMDARIIDHEYATQTVINMLLEKEYE